MRQHAIGKGSLSFWAALQEEYCQAAQQCCWVHKTANTLDKMPTEGSVQRVARRQTILRHQGGDDESPLTGFRFRIGNWLCFAQQTNTADPQLRQAVDAIDK